MRHAAVDYSALLTDFYSLTMAQGYWKRKMNHRAVFEMFFRRQPFDGGFSIFAGLGTLLERLINIRFSSEDLDYLKSLNIFEDGFLDYLKDFRFTGSLWAMEEGTVVFPNEPLIRVDADIIECQLIEGLLLNIINFQSLVATKTARIWLASGKGNIVEFGLRRAQGPDGALSASRAAYIGGASGTSNTLAASKFGIPVVGTMAHSWIMAYEYEEDAFHSYAELYPDKAVFLIDTYNTLKCGIVNAIKAGKVLAAKGKNFGVRLDSGDIQYLSTEARKMLDAAGLPKATITVSNDLDEYIIKALTDAKAPVDTWGVGTQLVTGGNDPAFNGVYKLAASCDRNGVCSARIKFSDNPEKTNNPGIKQVWRVRDSDGMCLADVLALEEPENSDIIEKGKSYSFWHPSADYRRFIHKLSCDPQPLLTERLRNGKPVMEEPGLEQTREYVRKELESLDQSHKRMLNPHIYKVSMTSKLRTLKLDLIKHCLGE